MASQIFHKICLLCVKLIKYLCRKAFPVDGQKTPTLKAAGSNPFRRTTSEQTALALFPGGPFGGRLKTAYRFVAPPLPTKAAVRLPRGPHFSRPSKSPFTTWSQLRNSQHRSVSGFAENCTRLGIPELFAPQTLRWFAGRGGGRSDIQIVWIFQFRKSPKARKRP